MDPLFVGDEPQACIRGVRLGFAVADVHAVIEAALLAGGTVMSSGDQAAVLKDPDGRKVEVTAREG